MPSGDVLPSQQVPLNPAGMLTSAGRTWRGSLPRSSPAARTVRVPGSGRPAALCDHESVPRGTASRFKTRYSVRLTVPRRGGWRAWGTVRADFERALACLTAPAIAAAGIASEARRGADYVRVTVALSVVAVDVAGALAIAWDAFRDAAADDLAGWESRRHRPSSSRISV